MQLLSHRLVRDLSALRPLRVIAWGRGHWGLPWLFLRAFAELLPALVLGRVSVLHLGDPVLAPLAALPRWFGVPVVVTVHGLDIEHPSPLYQAFLKICFWQRMQAYACISRHVRDLVLRAGIEPDKVLVIAPGVDPGAQPRPRDGWEQALRDAGPVLVSVGRLVERKGMPWFLREVAPAVLAAQPDARIVVAGEGPCRAAVDAAVAAAGLSDRVLVVGAVDESEKAWLLARSHLVLMPNVPVPGDAEGFGLVAIEAGMAGRWVFAADLEGLRDAVIDGLNGSRLPPDDARAWREAILRACQDLPALLASGAAAREVVRSRFSWPAMAAGYDDLFRTLEADAP